MLIINLDDIRKHWQSSGNQLSLNGAVRPTSRDQYLAQLESNNISPYLKPTYNILEVGCGDRNMLHEEFDNFIKQYFLDEEIKDYGLYLFLSRIYHPLVVSPEQPKHDSALNKVAGLISPIINIPDFKQYSYNLFYALRKKGDHG